MEQKGEMVKSDSRQDRQPTIWIDDAGAKSGTGGTVANERESVEGRSGTPELGTRPR